MGKKIFSSLLVAGLVTVGAVGLSQTLPTSTSTQTVKAATNDAIVGDYVSVVKGGQTIYNTNGYLTTITGKSSQTTTAYLNKTYYVNDCINYHGQLYYQLTNYFSGGAIIGVFPASSVSKGKGEAGIGHTADFYVRFNDNNTDYGYQPVRTNITGVGGSGDTEAYKMGPKKSIFHVKAVYYDADQTNIYYSLYDNKNNWYGYAWSGDVIKVQAQGASIKYNKYVTIEKKGYAVWSGFDFKTKKTTTDKLYHKTVLAKVKYKHANGSTYLSLYDKHNKWLGYVNASAAKAGSGIQGAAIGANHYVTITSKSGNIWTNFTFKHVKHYIKNYYHKTYQVKTTYNHFNGSTYLSLYDAKGKWFGYINAGATKTAAGQQGLAIGYNKKVTIKKTGYTIWGSFFGNKRGTSTKYKGKKLTAKVKYNCANGSTYLSLYSGSKWIGYVNDGVTK